MRSRVAPPRRARVRRPASPGRRPSAAASTVGNQPAPTAARSAGAVGRALGRADRRDLGLEDVGEDLAPERARVPPPEARIWPGARHPGRDHQVEPVAQAEGHALEDRPGEVAPVVAERSGRRTRRGPAGPGAGCARRSGRAGTAGRRCRPGRRRPPSTSSPNVDARAPARRGTSAGCRRPRASPTSGASARARRGRRRGPGRAGSTSGAVGRGEDDARRARATAPPRPARRPRRRPRWPPGRRRRRRPACRRAARSPRRPRAVTAPVTSGPSNVGGSQAGSIRSASSTSADQSRAARSNSSVPGAVGLVERVVAGQPEPDVVLGQQDVGDPRPRPPARGRGPRRASAR